jgi:glucose/arabinose dehydrogenase
MTQPTLLPAIALFTAFTSLSFVGAEEPKESDYYKITPIPAPEGEVIEGGGIELLPDGRVAVCTRRGQVWIAENAFSAPETPAKWTLFAEYLHEPLGLAWKDGWLYVVQRPEVTRLKDEDGDGRADIFETVSDGWGVNGNYHEYTFGSQFDKEGNIWCALCLTGSFTAESLYRGWILRISEDGKLIPTASGVRSPGGVGFNAEGDVFYTENQGAWNGSSSLKWIKPGSFQGNPNGNVYYPFTEGAVGNRPVDPPYTEEGSRTVIERANIPELVPPAVIFPHQKVGNSPTGIVPDLSEGKFGPFAGQVFVGEQTHSKIHRVFLEKVNGLYQGAMFPFLEGFQSGNIALRLSEDGAMFTSGSDRGWGARGGMPYSFERINWTGKVPFEIKEMRSLKDGFELTFTKPFDSASAIDASFRMEAYTYIYQKAYGSPEVDQVTPKVTVASVSEDGLSLKLKVAPLTRGHVHELHADGLKTKDGGHGLLHPAAYYTLNEIPE